MSESSQSSIATPADLDQFKVRVLLVDDQRIIIEAVRRMLGTELEFHSETDSAQAEAAAARILPSVILQDLVMPGLDGFALIAAYRANPALREVPVIVLSANQDAELMARAFAAGANDYMVKLPDQPELLARLRYHSAGYLSGLQRDHALRALRTSRDELAAAQLELQRLALLDPLTGIANRHRFDQALAGEWQRSQRDQRPLSLLICEIDHFKAYSEAHGQAAGEQCLKQAASVLIENLKRPADLAARSGGAEFALLLPDTPLAGALALAEACRARFEALAVGGAAAPGGVLSMSIGVASLVPALGASFEQLVTGADCALTEAKNGGRNRVRQYPPTESGEA